jgi:hypothetical protein
MVDYNSDQSIEEPIYYLKSQARVNYNSDPIIEELFHYYNYYRNQVIVGYK